MAYKDPEAQKAYSAAYYETNKEAQKAYSAAYYETNKEARKAYNAAYYETNKEVEKARSAAYYAANKEARKAYREANKEARKAYLEANKEAKKAYDAAYRAVTKERRRTANLASGANHTVRNVSKITLPFTALIVVHIEELVAVQGSRCAYEDHGGCKFPGQPMIYLPNSGDTMVSFDHIVARRWFVILQNLIKAGHSLKWKDPHVRWNRALVHLACNFAQGADFIEGIRSPLTGNIVRHILPDEYLDKDNQMDFDIQNSLAKDCS